MNKYDVFKLEEKDTKRALYVALLDTNGEDCLVRIINQPPYSIVARQYADDIFKQYCHEDDSVWDYPLNYNSKDMTINVHKWMLRVLTREELERVCNTLKYTNVGKTHIGRHVLKRILTKLGA